MDAIRFLFYANWRDQMDEMTGEELRRFIYNLCNYAEGKEVDLPTKIDRAYWLGILPALKINQEKYNNKVKSNRENGKLGGRPPKTDIPNKPEVSDTTQQNPNNPDGFLHNPNNLINDNWKEKTEKRKLINDNREEEKVNRIPETENSKMKVEDVPEDFSFNSIQAEEIFPVQDKVQYKSPMTEKRELMNYWFQDYPKWESDLLKFGIEEFILKTKEYHFNDPDYVQMIRDFDEM